MALRAAASAEKKNDPGQRLAEPRGIELDRNGTLGADSGVAEEQQLLLRRQTEASGLVLLGRVGHEPKASSTLDGRQRTI